MNKKIHKSKHYLTFKKKYLSFCPFSHNAALLQKTMRLWEMHSLLLDLNQHQGFQAYLAFPLSLRFEDEKSLSMQSCRKDIIHNDHFYYLDIE